jgi:hypothetical protein
MGNFSYLRIAAFAALVVGLTVSGASSASAQQPEATSFNFDDGESVSGNLMRPDGEIIDVPRTGRRPSLIRIRENFIPEMLRSAENL